MKKITLIAGLIFINCLLESCFQNIETCYSLEIVAAKNFTLAGFVETSAGDTVAANDYAILLDGVATTETCMTHYNFGGSLLAEDPVYTLIDKVANISIKSNSDLSTSYPAGSELKDLFTPIYIDMSCLNTTGNGSGCVYDYSSEESYTSLEQTFNGAVSESIFFGSEDYPQLFSLRIEEAITSNTHEITVQFDFENGILMALKTEEINLH